MQSHAGSTANGKRGKAGTCRPSAVAMRKHEKTVKTGAPGRFMKKRKRGSDILQDCRCQGCRKEIDAEQATSHLVRMGYSLASFPLLSYQRMELCPECLGRQKQRDKFEKGVALILLAGVCFFLGLGYLMLFNLV